MQLLRVIPVSAAAAALIVVSDLFAAQPQHGDTHNLAKDARTGRSENENCWLGAKSQKGELQSLDG